MRGRTWRREQYFISTDPALVPISKLINIFDSDDFYWANPMPAQAMQEMLDNSLCFGLYQLDSPDASVDGSLALDDRQLIGFARCVTDFTTFVYVTDVWVDPSLQGAGLGSWLVKCVQEIIEVMPHLRRSMLFTGSWDRSVPFYEKLMGMTVLKSQKGEGLAVMERKGRGHPSYGSEGSSYH